MTRATLNLPKGFRDLLRITAIFLLVSGLLSALVWLFRDSFLVWLVEVTSSGTNGLLTLAGHKGPFIEGNFVFLPSRTLLIAVECTAIYIMIIFTALVCAYPFRWQLKALFLPLGLVVIIVINYLRLVAVIVLASRIPLVLFDLIHDFLFQIGMIIVCLVLWLIMISIEHRRWDRRVALYILCVCVVSIMLETLCFGLARIVPSLPTSFTSFMVPTFAIIISAFGETWYKKAKWLLSYTVLFVIAGRLLVATGILNSPDNLTTLMLTLVVALYVIVYMGISLATVILFIGRRPSRLWGQI